MLTPEEFEAQMHTIAQIDDEESAHIEADYLMTQLLVDLGYEAGIKIFENMPRWYA